MKKTSNGLIYENFGDKRDIPVVFFAGMNVLPDSNYLCNFPEKLADHAEVYVVYQEAVSGKFFKKGFYSLATDENQLKAALELVNGRRFLPVTHSFSTVLGFRLLNEEYKIDNHAQKALPGIITSAFTNVEDLLIDHGTNEPRRVLGINALPLFKVLRYCPIIVPFFPLVDTNAHLNFGVNKDGFLLDRWVNPLTADYSFRIPDLLKSLNSNQKSKGVITLQDRIFSANEQRRRLEQFGVDIIEIDCGHRWMEHDDCANVVFDLIKSELDKWNEVTWSK